MSFLLHIETSAAVCSAALSRDGVLTDVRESSGEYVHAEKLTVFCEELLRAAGKKFSDLDAVAVSRGPGSYTGLRIGYSVAKGICYGAGIPLIAVDSLEALAAGVNDATDRTLICPMIDARRMEVYCAVYDHQLNIIREVCPEIITENSFEDLFQQHEIIFTGDGAQKCKAVLTNPRARFSKKPLATAQNMIAIAEKKFQTKNFADLALSEPFYLKSFQPGPKRSML